MREPILKTENLKVIYGLGQAHETRALDGVNVEIYPEEYVILFGPSGSGKSTLLYSLLGIEKPTSGKIYLRGKDISQFEQGDLIDARQSAMGIIFQAYHLISSLSVFDNVVLPQIFMGKDKNAREKKARDLLARFNIADQASKTPTNLSGGQQQRAAICRALINDPLILMADEPVGNLDSKSAESVMQTLKDINEKDKKTVILVTHDVNLLKYADRIYYLRDGKVEKMTEGETGKIVKPSLEGKERFNASALAMHLALDISIEQMKRFEFSIERFVSGNLSQDQFYAWLDKPIKDGGVGLYQSKAKDYTLKIKEILEVVSSLGKGGDSFHKLSSYLFGDLQAPLEASRMERLKKLVNERAAGKIDPNQFKERVDAPFTDGGVGLDIRQVEKISDRLEIVINLRNS